MATNAIGSSSPTGSRLSCALRCSAKSRFWGYGVLRSWSSGSNRIGREKRTPCNTATSNLPCVLFVLWLDQLRAIRGKYRSLKGIGDLLDCFRRAVLCRRFGRHLSRLAGKTLKCDGRKGCSGEDCDYQVGAGFQSKRPNRVVKNANDTAPSTATQKSPPGQRRTLPGREE